MSKHTPEFVQPQLTFNEIEYGCCKCGCGQKTTIAKRTRPEWNHVKGQPQRFMSGHSIRRPYEQRFWDRVDKNGPIHPVLRTACWLWTGHTMVNGYGHFTSFGTGSNLAHRIAWEITHGPIPNGLQVLHRCDVRNCTNPAHLLPGTQQENVDDMYAKDRADHTRNAKGERQHLAKLTAEKVLEIRARHDKGEPQKDIARCYGVTSQSVWAVVHRKTWKHI